MVLAFGIDAGASCGDCPGTVQHQDPPLNAGQDRARAVTSFRTWMMGKISVESGGVWVWVWDWAGPGSSSLAPGPYCCCSRSSVTLELEYTCSF